MLPTLFGIVTRVRLGGVKNSFSCPRKSLEHLSPDSVRARTKRNNEHDMCIIIKRLNSITRSWGNCFRGGVQKVPRSLDQWLRMRLRSILRKRDKRKGRGHGRDHNRYPNAWFAERGGFLITITHDSAASPTK